VQGLDRRLALNRTTDVTAYRAVANPGGVYNKAFGSFFWSNSALEALATPVDSDPVIDRINQAGPTSCLFRRENRMRITVAFADADNLKTPFVNPPPEVRLLRDTDHASFGDLPIILGE
jgi:hypothetical protein